MNSMNSMNSMKFVNSMNTMNSMNLKVSEESRKVSYLIIIFYNELFFKTLIYATYFSRN